VELKARSAAQEHFIDLCTVFEHPTGKRFFFEKGAAKHGGGDGFADVWKRGFFGIEYKGKHKDLDAACGFSDDAILERLLALNLAQ